MTYRVKDSPKPTDFTMLGCVGVVVVLLVLLPLATQCFIAAEKNVDRKLANPSPPITYESKQSRKETPTVSEPEKAPEPALPPALSGTVDYWDEPARELVLKTSEGTKRVNMSSLTSVYERGKWAGSVERLKEGTPITIHWRLPRYYESTDKKVIVSRIEISGEASEKIETPVVQSPEPSAKKTLTPNDPGYIKPIQTQT